LARRILDDLCRAQGRPPLALSERALAVLRAHAWPGNVRELRNALEAGTVFCTGGTIRPEDLQLEDGPGEIRPEVRSEVRPEVRAEVPAPGGAAAPDSLSLEDNEHQAILRALKHTGWNKTAAADELGISRRAIHYKIKKYGIGDPGPGEGR
ncbi:MAG: helix-turn-helix domain-containing protein, partial [Desulfovibrionaceae bacterium]